VSTLHRVGAAPQLNIKIKLYFSFLDKKEGLIPVASRYRTVLHGTVQSTDNQRVTHVPHLCSFVFSLVPVPLFMEYLCFFATRAGTVT